MINLHRWSAKVAILAAFFIAAPAHAQWQVPDHSVPVGRGAGTGFKSAAPGASGTVLTSNGASADPSFQPSSSLPSGAANQIPVYTGSGNTTSPTSATTWFDAAFCSTVGYVVARTTGAWVCSKSLPVNIEYFGGACDNSTDNLAPYNAALAAATAQGGGVITFPVGTCKFSGTLTVNADGVYIHGQGQQATILKPMFATGDVISLDANNYNGVSDLTINPGTTRTSGSDIVTTSHVSLIQRVRLQAGWDGITIDNTGTQTKTQVQDTVIEAHGRGVVIGENSTPPNLVNEVFLDNLTIASTSIGIDIFYCDGLYANSVSVYLGLSSLKIEPPSNKTVSHSYFNQFIGDSASQYAVTIVAGAGGSGTIGDIHFYGGSSFNSNLGGFNIDSSATGLSGLSITNSYIENNQQYGIYIGGGADVSISGNTIAYNSTSASNTYDGIQIQPNLSRISVTNNKVGAYGFFFPSRSTPSDQRYGIALIGGTSDQVLISNNQVIGNTTAGILNGGATGTHNRIESNIGYNPVGQSAVTVGSSPFSYTAGASPETLYVFSGATTSITLSPSGTTICAPCSSSTTGIPVNLGPNEGMTVTYTSVPFISRQIH